MQSQGKPCKHGIGAVGRLTGLPLVTIRAWETRYGVASPQRGPRGHRLYSSQDVVRLMRLATAVRSGHRIGEIAGCSGAELERMVAFSPQMAQSESDRYVEAMLGAVKAYDANAIVQLLREAVERLTPLTFVQSVVSPALRRVGEHWADGSMSIAQEHLLSNSISSLICHELQKNWTPAPHATVLCGTLAGEQHGIGCLLMGYLAGLVGYSVHFVGVDLPPAELRRLLAGTRARLAVLSVVTEEAAACAPAQLAELCSGLPPGLLVAMGGKHAEVIRVNRLPPACRLLPSAEKFLELLLDRY